jgi:hypothetical protein
MTDIDAMRWEDDGGPSLPETDDCCDLASAVRVAEAGGMWELDRFQRGDQWLYCACIWDGDMPGGWGEGKPTLSEAIRAALPKGALD